MRKKFKETLRPDLTAQHSGIFGFGRRTTVTSQDGRQTYTIDRKNENEQTAQLLNSKIPVAVIRPPQP